MRALGGLLLFAITISACTCEPEPPPAAPGPGLDSGLPAGEAGVDAMIADAGADAALADVATSSDAGSIDDAGTADTGELADAGTSTTAGDAGAIDDSGLAPDSGDPDGGGRDAGGACTSTLDCIPGSEACGDLTVINNLVETHCTPINPNGAALGGTCTTDAECHDGLCLTNLTGECSVVCADAARDCPAGFSCTGYRYNPGGVWVTLCNRTCADNDDCAAGAPGNFCSTQVFERSAMWFVDRVCQAPPGIGALGAQCMGGNDCQSGLCLTTTRNTGCMNDNDCMADETCQMGACVSRLCSYLCDDATDCAAPNQALTVCDPTIRLGLPDGTDALISACARN